MASVKTQGSPKKLNSRSPKPRLIYADSERDPDMLYATGFFVPDAFVFLEQKGKKSIVLSDLEVDRGRATAQVDEVLALTDVVKSLGLSVGAKVDEWLPRFLLKRKVTSVEVPQNFPLGVACSLGEAGIELHVVDGLFWAQRELKNETELKYLRNALKITAQGIARGIEVLAASTIGTNGVLKWGNAVLTSERLRAEIDSAVLRAGGAPANTIVAGGNQACDPHERGSGPLRSRELIIMDVFPRDPKTGYYGDMTRTVVKGGATDAQRHLWDTVRVAQQMVIKAMKPWDSGKALHESVQQFFEVQGFKTEQHKGRWRGFFHGTGHGLGLEIHEEPRFGRAVFTPGQVLTVEPGIYWPGVGGARIEDVVTVTDRGVRVLSSLPVQLEV
ncbi:MAG: Xaa-Pro peptidase family protein [Verrucomicrobiota bacterium]